MANATVRCGVCESVLGQKKKKKFFSLPRSQPPQPARDPRSDSESEDEAERLRELGCHPGHREGGSLTALLYGEVALQKGEGVDHGFGQIVHGFFGQQLFLVGGFSLQRRPSALEESGQARGGCDGEEDAHGLEQVGEHHGHHSVGALLLLGVVAGQPALQRGELRDERVDDLVKGLFVQKPITDEDVHAAKRHEVDHCVSSNPDPTIISPQLPDPRNLLLWGLGGRTLFIRNRVFGRFCSIAGLGIGWNAVSRSSFSGSKSGVRGVARGAGWGGVGGGGSWWFYTRTKSACETN